MKKIIALLLALAMVLSLAACGGGAEEDPNAGMYHGVSATVMGFTMPMSEVYENETWVELKSGGKGTMMLDGDDFSMKWTLEGETFTAAGGVIGIPVKPVMTRLSVICSGIIWCLSDMTAAWRFSGTPGWIGRTAPISRILILPISCCSGLTDF